MKLVVTNAHCKGLGAHKTEGDMSVELHTDVVELSITKKHNAATKSLNSLGTLHAGIDRGSLKQELRNMVPNNDMHSSFTVTL